MKSLEASEPLCLRPGGLAPPGWARSVWAPPAGTPTPPGTAVAQRAPGRGFTRRPSSPEDALPGSCRRRSGPTRLETRTKESDMGASSRVANPSAQRNRDSPSL